MALIAFNERVEDDTNRKFKFKKGKGFKAINLLLASQPLKWWEDPDILVAFNIPRISARLERLMGTNVVRLTDRKYMRDLRQRIDEEYRKQLATRIKSREIKELERERNLILLGKTDEIPDELSDDRIFVVNKKANLEIAKRSSKLKTSREKNAERLLRQGLKWERERWKHEERVRTKQLEIERIKKEQKALEQKYMEEDAERGLDLLRIKDTEWQECEQSLRDFLQCERMKMKERSLRVPTPFASDPKDIQNIVRERMKFRDAEKNKRLAMERAKCEKPRYSLKQLASRISLMASTANAFASPLLRANAEEIVSHVSTYLDDDEASGIPSTSEEQLVLAPPIPTKEQKQQEILEQMEADVHKGYLISSPEYSIRRYEDAQIAKLEQASNIRELYQIAEKIIIGEEDELMIPEEYEFEDEDENY